MNLIDNDIIVFIQQLNEDDIFLSHNEGKIVIKSNKKVSEERTNAIKWNKTALLAHLINEEKYSISSKYVIQFKKAKSNKYIFQLPGFMSLPTGLEYLMQSLTDYQAFGFKFNPEMDFIEYVTEVILSITNNESSIILTGICVGNLLAFEVCQTLENRGRKVDCLLMLTPPKGGITPRNHSLDNINERLDIVNKYVPETKKFHEDNPFFREKYSVPFLLYLNQLHFNKVLKTNIVFCYTSDFSQIHELSYWGKFTSAFYKIILLEGNHITFYDKEIMEINIPRIKSALEAN